MNESESEWYNEVFWSTLGKNITKEEIEWGQFKPHIHTAHCSILENEIDQALLHAENKIEHEVQYLHANGEYIWLRCHGKLAKDNNGLPRYLVKVYENLGEERIMADMVVDKLNMLTTILRSQEILFLRTNLQGQLTYVNQYYADYLGYPLESILGESAYFHALPEYHEDIKRVVATCLHNLDQPFKIQLKKKDVEGRELTSQWEFTAVSDHIGRPYELYCVGYDISKESSNLQVFQQLVYHMEDAVLKMTPDGAFTYASPKFISKYGFEEEELVGKSFQELVHPDDVQDAMGKVAELLSTGISPEPLEHRVKHKDGGYLWGETIGSLNPEGTEIIMITRDVSKSKEQKEKLKFQSHLLEAVSQSVIFFDTDWRVKYWNKGAEQLFGWKREEVMDAILPEGAITSLSTATERERLIQGLVKGKSWKGEFLVRHKDGHEFYALVANNPVKDDQGKIMGYIGVSTDITTLKKAEEDLLRNKQQMELAIDTAKLGIWELKLEDGSLHWNDELLSMYGLTREEFEKDIQGFRKRVFPEDLAVADHELQKIGDGEVVHDVRFRIQTSEGSVKHVMASGAPIYDEGGKIVKLIGINIDVSPIVEFESALKKTEDRFEAFANNIPGMAYIKYPKGKHVFGNQLILDRFGVDLETFKKLKSEDLIREELVKESNFLDDRVFITKQSQLRELHDPGSDKWYEEIKFSVDNDLIGGILLDISARKAAEETLQQYATQLQNILRSISDAFVTLDESGKFTYLNKKAEEIFGTQQKELLGKTILEVQPSWAETALDEALVRVKRTHKVEVLEEYLPDNQSWFEFRLYPSEEGISLFFLDITDQKQAEIGLIESEKKYRNITDSVPGAVLRYHLDPKEGKDSLLFLSQGAEEVWGIPWEEAFHDLSKLWKPVIKEDFEGLKQSIFKSAETMTYWDHQWRIRMSDGTIKWLNGKGIPTRLENGEYVWDSIILDISEIKEAEKVRLFAKQMERENKEMEQFAYIASHDLQEPLRTIQNFVMLLKENYLQNLDEEGELYIKFISDASNRMIHLIKGLLDFSRLGKKRKVVSVDVQKVVNDVLSDLNVLIDQTNTQVKWEGKPPVFEGFELELRLLFQNLISNAIKFRKPDEAPQIVISATPKGEEWEFQIKDNGIGIHPRHHHRIFNIFQRLHTHEKYEGTGIGLAHCKKIIELHKGTIWVSSEIGKGSTFHFTIKQI
ncbi:MAG: PAS domain S-box protein [Bacteroidota bacterium]